MPKIADLFPSLNAGELSPRLHSRVDFSKYKAGLEICENLQILPEGGVKRRAGTRYVAELEDSSVKGRLKKFQFSVTQAYMLELAVNKMHFFKNQGHLTVADTDAAVTNGEFTSNITDWDDVSGGSGAISHDATNKRLTLTPGGATAADIASAEQDITTTATNTEHVLKFEIQGLPGDKVHVQVGTSTGASDILSESEREVGYHCIAFTPTASPFYVQFRCKGTDQNYAVYVDNVSLIDNDAVAISTPYGESDLFSVEGPQSADELYFFHESYRPYKLQRYGDSSWSLVEVAFQDGPYLDTNVTSTTITPSAATGSVNLTLSATTGVNDNQGWLATDVGRLVRYKKSGGSAGYGYGIITSRTNATVAVCRVISAFEATPNASTTWALGAWSDTTGWPQVASFFEQRLYTGATTNQPQTVWASQTADFPNFAPDDTNGTIADNDALTFTLAADDVNAIRWMSAGEDTLVIGTEGGEWVPTASGIVITPNDITVRRQTTHGSGAVQPVRIGHIVLFVQKALRKIREFGFSFEVDSYVANDMTRLAEHITRGATVATSGIVEMAYQEEPDSVIWVVRNDGQLISLTYRKEEDVVGFARHILGGSFNGGNPVVETVVTIPGTNGAGQVQSSAARDEVWMIVKRTINGATKRYIEVMEIDYETYMDQEDAYYSDSIITYDSVATTTITGLDHLEGETVKVYADGYIATDATVSSGSITLDVAASTAQIGLGYTHKLKTLKLYEGNPQGTGLGRQKRVFSVIFSLLNSLTLSYGTTSSDQQYIDFRGAGDAMDTAPPLFTGEHEVEFSIDWSNDNRIYIESDAPAPFTLLAISPVYSINPPP